MLVFMRAWRVFEVERKKKSGFLPYYVRDNGRRRV